jgi:hypothetical protein
MTIDELIQSVINPVDTREKKGKVMEGHSHFNLPDSSSQRKQLEARDEVLKEEYLKHLC